MRRERPLRERTRGNSTARNALRAETVNGACAVPVTRG